MDKKQGFLTKLGCAAVAVLALAATSCGGQGPAADGSDLVGAFAEAAWDAAAPHFEGLEPFAGDAFRDEEYPFAGDPEAADGFLGFASPDGDAAARYPEREPCPELDDIVIHGGAHQRVRVSPDAAFAPAMGFRGREVDALFLVVSGMYGSTWYQSSEGTLYKTDYAVLLLMSDGSSLFAGLGWESSYFRSMFKYAGNPAEYLLNETPMGYKASFMQSVVGRVPDYDLCDFAVVFRPNESKTAIGEASFAAAYASSVGDGYQLEERIEILGGLSEAVFEEHIPVESLREEYGPEWERELRQEEETSAS